MDNLDQRVNRRLRDLLAGDRSAAAWLYDSFAGSFFRRLRQRYPFLEPEDLLQDAFVYFFRRDYKVVRDFLAKVPPEARTRAALDRYLWNVVCGLASNRRRSFKLLKWLPLIDSDDDPSPEPNPERSAVDRDRLARLDDCLRRSGERLYLYFKLRYRDELTPEEISRATGWSRKATYKLKQKLNDAALRCAQELGLDR